MVREQVSDNPVYVIHPEGDDQGRTRTLHRNLLLLVNELPMEISQPTAEPTSTSKQRQTTARARVKGSRNQTENVETSDSDDDLGSGYWLRIPPAWTESGPTVVPDQRPVISQGQKKVVTQVSPKPNLAQTLRGRDESVQRAPIMGTQYSFENLPDLAGVQDEGQPEGESQAGPKIGPTLQVDDVGMEEGNQDEWQLRDEVGTAQDDELERSDSPACVKLPQSESESPQQGCGEEPITDHVSGSATPLRRSTRQRRPGQMLTYSSLGHPTYQLCPTINTVSAYIVPSADLCYLQPYSPPFQSLSFQFPHPLILYPVHSY